VALGLGGCLYAGGIENPIARRLNWFSYLAGDDIKRNCAAGAPAQYRLVYNASWFEQVRAYDLRHSATGDGATLWTHVFGGGGDISKFDLADPTAPWAGQSGQARLDEPRYLELIRAIEASGFGGPAPEGTRLQSWDFYWAVSACAAGQFHFNAWLHPSDRFSAITFDRLLFASDNTGVRPNPPRRLDQAIERARHERADLYSFELVVGRDGLVGRLPPI
jgi:hypothetical protein